MHYDMEDLLEQANEIQESLGRSYAVPDEIDEADLEAGKSRCRSIVNDFVEGDHQNWMHYNWRMRRKAPRTSQI
jgi:hypothetical protein